MRRFFSTPVMFLCGVWAVFILTGCPGGQDNGGPRNTPFKGAVQTVPVSENNLIISTSHDEIPSSPNEQGERLPDPLPAREGEHASTEPQVAKTLTVTIFGGRGQQLVAWIAPTSCAVDSYVAWFDTQQQHVATGMAIDDPIPHEPLTVSVSCDGQSVTHVLAKQTVFMTQAAFAVVNPQGAVSTWGGHEYGGHSPTIQGVRQLTANEWAFAAWHTDGHVTAWGRSHDYNSARLHGLSEGASVMFRSIHPTKYGFIMLSASKESVASSEPVLLGSILPHYVCSMDKRLYAKTPADISSRLPEMAQVVATQGAYAVLLKDGSVLTWGEPGAGHDDEALPKRLTGITHVYANESQFVAKKSDGHIVVWGADLPFRSYQDEKVTALHGTRQIIVASQQDGTFFLIAPWQRYPLTRFSLKSASTMSKIRGVFATQNAFAILRRNGVLEIWDDSVAYPNLEPTLIRHNVRTVATTEQAFAILMQDGHVETWGDPVLGGNTRAVASQLYPVVTLTANDYAFAALRADGTVITWGMPTQGGDSSSVRALLTNVRAVYATSLGGFLAIREDGRLVTWGDVSAGGRLPALNLSVQRFVPSSAQNKGMG